nr:hypothetical protein CFP56_09048 [Quercus suber]
MVNRCQPLPGASSQADSAETVRSPQYAIACGKSSPGHGRSRCLTLVWPTLACALNPNKSRHWADLRSTASTMPPCAPTEAVLWTSGHLPSCFDGHMPFGCGYGAPVTITSCEGRVLEVYEDRMTAAVIEILPHNHVGQYGLHTRHPTRLASSMPLSSTPTDRNPVLLPEQPGARRHPILTPAAHRPAIALVVPDPQSVPDTIRLGLHRPSGKEGLESRDHFHRARGPGRQQRDPDDRASPRDAQLLAADGCAVGGAARGRAEGEERGAG